MRAMEKNVTMRVVVLTGAGISAESGVATFRDSGGLWEGHDIQQVATPEGFAADPDLVLNFYDARRAQVQGVEPNAAHLALATLGEHLGDRLTIVTQNVDDLHERAGSRNVIHMHGELLSAWCTSCGIRHAWRTNLIEQPPCPSCQERGLRPDIVWFGEIPYQLGRIEQELVRADLFVSIGTSGNVYPAAGFVEIASQFGVRTLELNLELSAGTGLFDDARQGPASVVVHDWVAEFLSSQARPAWYE